jgi:lipopolysaccharide assembly protein A
MRLFYFILLLLFLGAIIAFAVQNRDGVAIRFMDWNDNYPLPILLGAAYVLGMFSGWSVVGMVRRSLQRVTEHDR